MSKLPTSEMPIPSTFHFSLSFSSPSIFHWSRFLARTLFYIRKRALAWTTVTVLFLDIISAWPTVWKGNFWEKNTKYLSDLLFGEAMLVKENTCKWETCAQELVSTCRTPKQHTGNGDFHNHCELCGIFQIDNLSKTGIHGIWCLLSQSLRSR